MLDDLIADFIAEASEGLELVDKELIELENNPEKSELIDDIFRVIHSIKGTCGFFGLEKLASIAHSGEEIISRIRDKKLVIDQNSISILLEVIDSIKTILVYIGENGKEPEIDFSELIQKIGKKETFARGAKVDNLLKFLRSTNNNSKKTLSGCIIQKLKNSVIISSEKR